MKVQRWMQNHRGVRMLVQIEFDENDQKFRKMVTELANRAMRNASGVAKLGYGAISVRVLETENPRQEKLRFEKP